MAQEQESFWDALAHTIGCLLFIIFLGGLIVLGFVAKVTTLTNEVKSVQKEFEQTATIEGEIAKIENSTGPDKIVEDRGGNITMTLKVSPDRTKIYFKDGRSKEFIGMPTKPIEIGKYYKIKYNSRYNILGDCEIVDE